MDRQSDEARQSKERLRRLQEQIKEQQQKDNNVSGSHYCNTYDEQRTLEDLQKKLADARDEGLRSSGVPTDAESTDKPTSGSHYAKPKDQPKEGRKTINEKAVSEIAEEA